MKCVCSVLTWLLVASVVLVETGCREPMRSEPDSVPMAATMRPAAGATQDDAGDRSRLPVTGTSQVGPAGGANAAEITVQEPVYDFGEVAPRTKHTGRFAFTNTGDSPLKITEVKKCCGVLTEVDKRELAPGESGVLTVVYTAGAVAGNMARQVQIVSNDPGKPEVSLTIKARVVPKVACTPRALSLSLKGENAGCPEITVASTDNQPFSIKAFTSTDNCLTADVDTSVRATQFVLRPTVNLDKIQGHSTGVIRISVTHPECEGVDIHFTVLPKFVVMPSMLLVTDARPQVPTVRDVTVRSNYNEEFEIESVSSKSGSVRVLGQSKTRNGYRFKVEIVPPQPNAGKGNGAFADALYVNTAGGEQLSVNVYEYYAAEDGSPDVTESRR